jgi:hypothetical protein
MQANTQWKTKRISQNDKGFLDEAQSTLAAGRFCQRRPQARPCRERLDY